MTQALSLWMRFHDKPLGKWLFARLICWKAAYFGAIASRVEELKPDHARISKSEMCATATMSMQGALQ